MNTKSLIVILTLILGWSFEALSSSQRHHFEDDADERAKPVILLKKPIYGSPSVCVSQDFQYSCGTRSKM